MYKSKKKKDEHAYEMVTVAKWILDQGLVLRLCETRRVVKSDLK